MPGPLHLRALICMTLLVLPAMAQQNASPAAASPGSTSASPTAKEEKESRRLYQRALRLTGENRAEEAYTVIQEAASLNQMDYAIAAANALMKQQLVSIYTERGNALLETGKFVESLATFRQALELDPANTFLQQRIQDASSAIALPDGRTITPLPSAEPVLAPFAGTRTVTHRGDSKRLLELVGRTFGLRVMLDDSVQNKQVRFDLTADYATVSGVAMKMAKVFAIPMAEDQVLFAPDNPETRRRLEHLSLQTFQVGNASTPQDLQEVANALRTILEARFISTNALNSTITVRAPAKILQAAASLMRDLAAPKPELMIEVHAIQLASSRTRNLGLDLPLQFTIFNVPTELRQLLNQPGAQDLINRLISGGLTPADAAALAGLLAAQKGGSPLTQPFATFGGGTTLTGITIPSLGARFGLNESQFSSLQRMTLRSQQGQAATFRVGDRIPVITATFNSPPRLPGQTAQQFIPPTFNYEELGVTLKTTPMLNEKGEVILQLELQLRSLTGVNINGIPAISNREYKGTVTMKQGEVTILAGSMETASGDSVRGLPFLSRIPGFRHAFASTQKVARSSELLFLITPRVIRGARTPTSEREVISLD